MYRRPLLLGVALIASLCMACAATPKARLSDHTTEAPAVRDQIEDLARALAALASSSTVPAAEVEIATGLVKRARASRDVAERALVLRALEAQLQMMRAEQVRGASQSRVLELVEPEEADR